MNPAAIIGGVSGLMGMFGRKTSPYEREAAALLKKQGYTMDEILRMVRAYDPAKEDAAAIRAGENASANAYKNATGSLLQKYGRNPGDTNYMVDLQRSSDDVLNPLAMYAAEQASTRTQRKMQMYSQAMATASPGQLAGQYMEMSRAPRPSTMAAQQLFGQSLDSILGSGVKPRQSVSEPGADFSRDVRRKAGVGAITGFSSRF